jgi:uncharacterized protein with HEPN domain
VNKPWQPYAQHILDAIAKIRRIQARGDLRTDEVLYDATLRNLQTLSEARCPGIPWREIRGFRNVLVHNYLGDIDPATVAAVVDTHLQPLEDCVQELLAADEG